MGAEDGKRASASVLIDEVAVSGLGDEGGLRQRGVSKKKKKKKSAKFLDDSEATVDEKELKELEKYIGFKGFLRTFYEEIPNFYTFKQYCMQTVRDIWRNKMTFSLGFSACFLVVLVIAMMVSVLSHTPVVFLSLAELEQGEIDVIISPLSSTGYDFFNYTLISEIFEDQPDYTYHTPRNFFAPRVTHWTDPRLCDNSVKRLGNDTTWMYTGLPNIQDPCANSNTCFDQLCSDAVSAETTRALVLVDSERENLIGVGREFANKSSIPRGSIWAPNPLMKDLKLSIGDKLNLRFYMSAYFPYLWDNACKSFLNSTEGVNYNTHHCNIWRQVNMPVDIAWYYHHPDGKTGVGNNNYVYMEFESFIDYVADHLHPDMPQSLKDKIRSWNLYEYANQIIINYPPKERMDMYTNSNFDIVAKRLISFTSAIQYQLGLNQVNPYTPVLDALQDLQIVALFLGLILDVITFILLFLSVLLIYSLLMVSVETRTFEMGILRMVGMSRGGIVQLLLIQAFSYAIPAWFFGIIAAEIGSYIASLYFKYLTGIPIDANLTVGGIVAATVLGIAIPVISSLLPIRQALGKNLHDSIDVRRSKAKAVEMHIERAEDSGVNWPLVVMGLSLAIFGFIIYYVIPLALLSMQLSLLLNIFFMLLIMMLQGLVMLSINAQYILERVLVYTLLFWDKLAIRTVVLKNLVAHRRRNRKTTMMYALSLGFIIFTFVSYDVQINSMVYMSLQQSGTPIKATVRYTDEENAGRINNVEAWENWAANNPNIEAFGWASYDLEHSCPHYAETDLSNLGRVFSDYNDFFSVPPGLFGVLTESFLRPKEVDDSDSFGLLEKLYTPVGTGSALLGSVYKRILHLTDLSSHFLTVFDYENEYYYSTADVASKTVVYRIKPVAFMNGAPFFKFSQFPAVRGQDLLVGYPTWRLMCQQQFTSMDQIPLGSFFAKPTDPEDSAILDNIEAGMRSLLSSGPAYYMSVSDYRDILQPIKQANIAMNFFFSFTVIVAMAISFFSLMSSMYTNIYEQAKEIGILRAVGMPYGWLQRVYIYEAFILVLSSSLMGMLIGSGVGWTVAIQRVLFTQLPIPFEFPILLFLVVFFMSIVFALISSWTPVSSIMKRPIVSILRMF